MRLMAMACVSAVRSRAPRVCRLAMTPLCHGLADSL